jgi:hypothetical protein
LSKLAEHWRLWTRDDAVVEQNILAGKETEPVLTAYGDNDLVLGFLMQSKLWAVMTGMEADGLRCRNGYSQKVLNGVEVIRELAAIKRIQHCGKVLHDTRLMMQAGFNLEQLARASRDNRGVIDTETLSNHLGRISPPSAQQAFREHLQLIRRKRWLRGTLYVADAHEIIIPYGRRHERLGQVGAKHGFKLVILINISEDQERIVGFSFAPLPTSEKSMLAGILRRLDRDIAPLAKWLKILILDRGYWGAEYLLGLHRQYGIDLVTRAQHDGLQAVDWIDTAASVADWREQREERSRLGTIRVKVAGVPNVPLYAEGERLIGYVNAVVADEYDLAGKRLKDEDGNERGRFYYITTLDYGGEPYRMRGLYRKRWVVENQGFRELSQAWALNTLVGRSFQANYARLGFVFMLYNAERILRWKYGERWAAEKQRLADWGEQGRLGGLTVVVYTKDGRLGLYSVKRYRELVQRAERHQVVRIIRVGLEQGRDPRDLLNEVEP